MAGGRGLTMAREGEIEIEVTATWERFIDADAAELLDDDDDATRRCVVLSFGDESGPIRQVALSLPDARDLVAAAVAALARHGDATAEAIGEAFFSGPDSD
jgi:hypothetical protein